MGDKPATGAITVIRQLSAEQRAFIWKDTARGPDGYLRVRNEPAYLDLVADFRNDAKRAPAGKPVARLRPGHQLPGKMSLNTAIAEDPHRTTYVFDDAGGGAALTIWNFQKAGAKVSVIEEVLNQSVGGHRGTLALNVANQHKNALWKLAWWDRGIGYELYVPDSLAANGLPQRRSRDIVNLGAALSEQLVLTR